MAIIKNKAVVKLGLGDDKSKKATQKALVDMDGFTSYTLDFEKSTLVMIGDTDPTVLVHKLRKFVSAHLMTFGPEKDEGKLQKNTGSGGNVEQQPPKQPPQPQKPNVHQQQQQQQHFYPPFDHGIRTSGYGYGYGYN